jgi:hypothetical protein
MNAICRRDRGQNYGSRLKDLVITSSLIRHLPYDLPLDQGSLMQSFPDQIVTLKNAGEGQAEDFPLVTGLQPGKTYQINLSYQSEMVDPEKGYPVPLIKLQDPNQDSVDAGLIERDLLSGDGAVIPIAVLISLPESWIEATVSLGVAGGEGTLKYQDMKIDQLERTDRVSGLAIVYLSHSEVFNALMSTLVRTTVINRP